MRRIPPFLLLVAALAAGSCSSASETPAGDMDVAPALDTSAPPTDTGALPPDAPDLSAPKTWMLSATAVAEADPERMPQRLHQTWETDPTTTVTVQWTTELRATEGYEPRVWFARADEVEAKDGDTLLPFDEAHVAVGTAYHFTTFLTAHELFLQCEVQLTGLAPHTDYVFRAGSWADVEPENGQLAGATLSPLHSLRTALPAGDATPIRILAAGDSRGGYDNIAANAPRLAELDPDFIVFTGDMTQMGSWDEWGTWFGAMSALSNNHVLMPLQGNHEVFGELFYYQFALPREAGLEEDFHENAWSFVYGNTLVIGLNSMTQDIVDAQVAWLEARLEAAADDDEIVWKIVTYHHPAYSSSNHGSTGRVRDTWLPIFERFGVDLAIAGHDHNYERSVPIKAKAAVADGEGVVHVNAGGFFAPGYSPGSEWWTVISHHGDKHNYVVVEIDGATLQLTAYSGDGSEILDEFSLTK